MTEQEANDLLKRYKMNQCTNAERAFVDDWFSQYSDPDFKANSKKIEQLSKDILNNLPQASQKKGSINLWPLLAAVAALSLISFTVFFYFKVPSVQTELVHNDDITPGGNKAILTLADGKTIDLSASKTGVVIQADKISYNDGTAISDNNKDNVPGLATITTPRGGTYQITLPDGTKVWLNAASSLAYSTSLKERGEDRSVILSGEAYFEVYKDKKRPFVVSTSQQKVVVLGTHFNINAYENGITKTTLLEGSVKVQISSPRAEITSKVLVPGEQSINKNGSINVNKVNTNIELAWKKDKIQFVRTDLKTVMDMISRWYDIDVIYQYYPVGGKFTGSISRSKNISEVLNLLETTGDVRFKIEERKVLVMK